MTKEVVHLVNRLTKLYSWVIAWRNHRKPEFIGEIVYFVRRKMFLNGTFFEAIKKMSGPTPTQDTLSQRGIEPWF